MGVVKREREAEGGVAVDATADRIGEAGQKRKVERCDQLSKRRDGCRPVLRIRVVPVSYLLGKLEQPRPAVGSLKAASTRLSEVGCLSA